MTNPPLWLANSKRINASNMLQLQNYINLNFTESISTYSSLHNWTVTNKELFWDTVAKLHPIIFHDKPTEIYQQKGHVTEGKWFVGATLNYAENLLVPVQKLDEAIIAYTEENKRQSISGKELYRKVSCLANYLRGKGLVKGDRVAGIVTNSIETVIAMLATTSIGAIWSSCSPDFGEREIQDRFIQIEPKILFCSISYTYACKQHDISSKVTAVIDAIKSIEESIDLSSFNRTFTQLEPLFEGMNKAGELRFEPVCFQHPLFIMYSSGTTGKPKCIVHTVGGTLIQHVKEHGYHVDLHPGDKIFYFTTCGWMMWNWLVSALASGACLMLFDGSPFHPTESILFDLIDKEECKVMGVSAKYILACEKAGLKPAITHKLPKLETILSTGSPLGEQSFSYIYQNVKENLCLSSISGGTDIISCFLLGNPCLDVYAGELQCKGLGMDVNILNSNGDTVMDEKGELTCSNAFPSMPLGFWQDAGNVRYRESYFSTFEDKWCQSDMAEEVEHTDGCNGFIIHGRSDTVLNPGGVRIGTSEIYRQIDHLPKVIESLVIGKQKNDDIELLLFVVLAPGEKLSEDLTKTIKSAIRNGASPRHVPDLVFQVQDTPKTLSGKIAEKSVMNIFNDYYNTGSNTALSNPDCLIEYLQLKKELA